VSSGALDTTVADWRETARGFGAVVCASTADFNAPLWTNKQHLMSRIAAEIPVLYVESLGLRRPRPTRRDAVRVARRLSGVTGRRPSSGIEGLEVASPLVLPYHGLRAARAVNGRLLASGLGRKIAQLPRPRLLWAYSPAVIDELDLSFFDRILYHAVDDLGSVPGVPGGVALLEARLARRADAVVASADRLASRLARFNPNTHLVGNVADVDHFAAALRSPDEPSDVSILPRPRAIFVGALSDHKVDWPLVVEIVEKLPEWSFIVIGPPGEEASTEGWRRAAKLPNCRFLGHRSYAELPSYLAAADVGLIPYRLTDHTSGIWPLKLVEYLAAGLGVVATPLEALRTRTELPVSLCPDSGAFAAAIEAVDRSEPARRARSLSVADRSWDRLLDRIYSVIPAGAVDE
jgi:glycosyltransferase involved in cell wall biosynthesis